MIVIVTNRQDHTADFLILELQRRQADYVRFNTEDFPCRVQATWNVCGKSQDGFFSFPKSRVDFGDIRSIWYRRPVPPIPSSEITDPVAQEFIVAESKAMLDSIWRNLDCFWVSHPDSLSKAEHKLYQLKVAQEIGFELPPTIVTNSPEVAQAFYTNQDRAVIYKPLHQGRLVRGEAISLIYTNPIEPEEARHLEAVTYAPSLFQAYVPKHVEIRVTVIGRQVFAVEIRSQDQTDSRHDWRRGDATALHHELHSLPPSVESKCVALVRTLNLAFGAIDMILTPDGKYVFLEVNPNGQWAWIQQLCPDIPLRETLAELLMSGGLQ
jgi:glutathione synthase/RimK-type ligase-like ATP-grasp enzyme